MFPNKKKKRKSSQFVKCGEVLLTFYNCYIRGYADSTGTVQNQAKSAGPHGGCLQVRKRKENNLNLLNVLKFY